MAELNQYQLAAELAKLTLARLKARNRSEKGIKLPKDEPGQDIINFMAPDVY